MIHVFRAFKIIKQFPIDFTVIFSEYNKLSLILHSWPLPVNSAVVGYFGLKTSAKWIILHFFQREAKDEHIIYDPDKAVLII